MYSRHIHKQFDFQNNNNTREKIIYLFIYNSHRIMVHLNDRIANRLNYIQFWAMFQSNKMPVSFNTTLKKYRFL